MSIPPTVASLVRSMAEDQHGLLVLANALDSVTEALVQADFVCDLLLDVADELAASPPGNRWTDAFNRVCEGKVLKPRRSGGYMRSSSRTPRSGCVVSQWKTVMKASVWQDLHLDHSKSSAPLPPFPMVQDDRFTERFKARVAQPDWFQPPTEKGGAWLGRPAHDGANCWVSSNDLDTTFSTPAPAGDLNGSARRVVEALGLLPKSPFDAYVRYTIDASKVAVSPGMNVGLRPTFADRGNEWFRVTSGTTRAEHYRKAGWGSTVNLAACRVGYYDDTGRPERVSPSIPVSAETVLDIDILYPRVSDYRFSEHPVKNFRASLLRGRTRNDIEKAIAQFWKPVTPKAA